MDTTVEVVVDQARIVLGGDVDMSSLDDARAAFEPLAASEAPVVTADLGAVGFMDSSALGMLVGWHKRLAREGRSLVLDQVPPRVLRMLTLTGLDSVITVRPAS